MKTLSATETRLALGGITHRRHALYTSEQSMDITPGGSDKKTEEDGTPRPTPASKPRKLTEQDKENITQAAIRRRAAQQGKRIFIETFE